MSTVVSDVLETAIAERIERLLTIKQDLDAVETHIKELGRLFDQISDEIEDLKDAYMVELDHAQRVE